MSLPSIPKLVSQARLAFTGHRPPKLGGYSEQVSNKCFNLALHVIKEMEPGHVISGMALGWDMEVAYAAITLGVPVIAAVPFAGHDALWPLHSQERLRKILARCDHVRYVSQPGYQSYKLHARNRWMCDEAHALCALWDGQDDGGTFRCVQYANSIGLPITNVWNQFTLME